MWSTYPARVVLLIVAFAGVATLLGGGVAMLLGEKPAAGGVVPGSMDATEVPSLPPVIANVASSVASVAPSATAPPGEDAATTATSVQTEISAPAPEPSPLALATVPPTTTQRATSSSPLTVTTVATALELDWPEVLPAGMGLAVNDSWPVQMIALGREHEPFLIFRGDSRWLTIRNQNGPAEQFPPSATIRKLDIAGSPAVLIRYLGDDAKLLVARQGRIVQISGHGVSDEELVQIVTSLRPLTEAELRARLTQEASNQKPDLSLFWPSYLPDGLQLTPAETVLESPNEMHHEIMGYRVSFRSTDTLIQIGGGHVDIPAVDGTHEKVVSGSLAGDLTTADRRFLLVLGEESTADVLRFPGAPNDAEPRLPNVQQGPIFIMAENIDRETFDRVVAGLTVVRLHDFVGRAHGEASGSTRYWLPSELPDGFTIDRTSIRVGWDDYILQGGRPFFEYALKSSNNEVVIARGGAELGGAALVAPEGPGVERVRVTVHGRTASAARTPEGSSIVWTEDGSTTVLSSPSLTIEQLVAIGEALRPVTLDAFFDEIK